MKMPIEDFEGNVPPLPPPSDGGYRPPSIPPAYKPPEIVDPPYRPPSGSPPNNGGTMPSNQTTPIPDNIFGWFMLMLGL